MKASATTGGTATERMATREPTVTTGETTERITTGETSGRLAARETAGRGAEGPAKALG